MIVYYGTQTADRGRIQYVILDEEWKDNYTYRSLPELHISYSHTLYR